MHSRTISFGSPKNNPSGTVSTDYKAPLKSLSDRRDIPLVEREDVAVLVEENGEEVLLLVGGDGWRGTIVVDAPAASEKDVLELGRAVRYGVGYVSAPTKRRGSE